MALIIKAEVSLEASAFLFRGWVWLALTLFIFKWNTNRFHKYSSWDFACMKKNESVPAGCAGFVVWKKGHVELDIGYGACIGIGSYGNTMTLTMLNTRDFTSSHLIDGLIYEGAGAR